EEINLVNPNTGTCPTFRTRKDAELSIKIYRNSSILKHEKEDEDDIWGIELRRMFNSGDDSDLFERKWDLEEDGWELMGNIFEKEDKKYLPVYESKMIHQYDHRFKTYRDQEKSQVKDKNPREVTPEKKDDPEYCILPPYWVSQQEYLDQWNSDRWHIALRKVARATDKRTVIASVIPAVATEDSINHILDCDGEEAPILLSCLNSFVLDYAARRKVGGANLNQYIAKQLPVPKPGKFENITVNGESLYERVKKLSSMLMYTSNEISNYA
ncbi:MAG: restriction endonuclease, partial [Halobacteriaceae archaeon]